MICKHFNRLFKFFEIMFLITKVFDNYKEFIIINFIITIKIRYLFLFINKFFNRVSSIKIFIKINIKIIYYRIRISDDDK